MIYKRNDYCKYPETILNSLADDSEKKYKHTDKLNYIVTKKNNSYSLIPIAMKR